MIEANKIRDILKGIDLDETYHKEGWWETSFGVAFGKERLEQLIEYIESEKEDISCNNCKYYLSDNGNYPLEPCGECSRFYSDMFEPK